MVGKGGSARANRGGVRPPAAGRWGRQWRPQEHEQRRARHAASGTDASSAVGATSHSLPTRSPPHTFVSAATRTRAPITLNRSAASRTVAPRRALNYASAAATAADLASTAAAKWMEPYN